jgi:hypothetical protein
MATNDYSNQSSGRWDSDGSFNEAVEEQQESAFKWASSLELPRLIWAVRTMASNTNAFSLYERKALLGVVALKLESVL